MGIINNRLVAQQPQLLNIEEFLINISKGKSYISGFLADATTGRKQSNIQNINFFSLDVDNHYIQDKKDVHTNYTRVDAIRRVKAVIGITPVAIYKTFSGANTDGSERFRMIYVLDHETDYTTIQDILRIIVLKCEDMFDRACVDASRIFLGTNKDAYSLLKSPILLTSDKIVQVIAEHEAKVEAERQIIMENYKPKNIEFDDNGAVETLKTIDITDYLGREGYRAKRTAKGYKMPCPIHHGKKDNFNISNINGTWVYKCFSGCGGEGGTIIDLYMALHNVDNGEAIKQLCNMYGIDNERSIKKASTIADKVQGKLTVEKYISKDTKATQAILESIKANYKILVTGAMGIGKTHFIRTDLLIYAKSIHKKIVMVVPGVEQLENLKENKDLDIVYSGVGYYGSDITAVTPDSLISKVLCKLKPHEYILVVDEAHQKILDSSFRKAFKNISIAERDAFKIVYMTATPRVLINEEFNDVIEIKTNNPIKNKITYKNIVKSKESLTDIKLEIVKKSMKKYDNVAFFQNDKQLNSDMAEIIKTSMASDFVSIANSWKWENTINIVQSGQKNEEIKQGLLTANITFVTSVITAGIDLRILKGNKGLLIIDATERIDIDSFIQLIGRFRDGIDVLILTKEREKNEEYLYKPFENNLNMSLPDSGTAKELLNNAKFKDEYKDGVIEAFNLEYLEGLWQVDTTKAIKKAYDKMNNSLLYDIEELKRELKHQTAFKVIGEVEKCEWLQEELQVGEELRELKTARKEEFKGIKEKLIKLDDETIMSIIKKDIDSLASDKKEIATAYIRLQPSSHKEKINLLGKELFIDSEGIVDIVQTFKYFYSNSWNDIQLKLDQKETRAINRDIKVNGIDVYLNDILKMGRTCKDALQAKIRYELKEVEAKRGRLTDKLTLNCAIKLVNEGYLRNKATKIYLDADSSPEDKEKAINDIASIVNSEVQNIYNFWENSKGSNSISSVKY